MSLMKNLLLTYEKCKDATGITNVSVDVEKDEKKTFLPIFHTTLKSSICITLDEHGNFVKATRDNKDITIIIPCTESSAGRAGSKISAHPLCDQLDYVGAINDDKTKAYLAELKRWRDRETGYARATLEAIYRYVNAGKMLADLEEKGVFKDKEYKIKGDSKILDNEEIRKIGVRFIVESPGDICKVWENKELRTSWINYLKPRDIKEGYFDYLSGEPVKEIAGQHPKNINSKTANAKLISCNTEYGFRFVGRFIKQDDAVIVDYEQSQKMHQTLRWLINNYGYDVDTQTIVVWAVDTDTTPLVPPYKNSLELFSNMTSKDTDVDVLSEIKESTDINYSNKFRNLLQGFGNVDHIKEHLKTICIAVFDAATSGRMGLTFYQELPQDVYLEKIAQWHEETSYYLTAWIKEKDSKGREISLARPYIGAPSYDDIIFAVHGKSQGGNDAGYNTLKRKVRKQLLESMFGNFSFPKNMVSMATIRASNPMVFRDSNGSFSSYDWERSVNITCALVRKLYKQEKEEIILGLDEKRDDRDYLYGRLLAVADRLEEFALYKADKTNTRATNAVRLMAAFQVRPYHTWGVLHQQLIPYKNQLNGAGYYQSIIDVILLMFKDRDFESNAQLSPLYLLGFSAQRRAFFKEDDKNQKQENTEEN
jgi:CRISPR-associated protein Csd1